MATEKGVSATSGIGAPRDCTHSNTHMHTALNELHGYSKYRDRKYIKLIEKSGSAGKGEIGGEEMGVELIQTHYMHVCEY